MNKKYLLTTICTTLAFCVLTTIANAQVVVFSNDFEDGDLAAEIGSMDVVASTSAPSVVPVTDGPDATLGSNVGLIDRVASDDPLDWVALDMTWNLTNTLSLAGSDTVSVDFDLSARRTSGTSKTIFVDALDSSGNIVSRFVLGDNNVFGNGGNDRQRPGFATLAGGNMIFGTPPGSFWWGADGNPADGFDPVRDAHVSLTIGASSFDVTTEGAFAGPFTATAVSNYDGTSANIASIRLTSAVGVGAEGNYGAYFDNIVVAGVIDDSTVLLGDVNCDGNVDFLDIGPFISLLSSGGFLDKADIDGSQAVDFLDIGPFIGLLSS